MSGGSGDGEPPSDAEQAAAWDRLEVLAPELVEAGELFADRAEQTAAAAKQLAGKLDGSNDTRQEAVALIAARSAEFAESVRRQADSVRGLTASVEQYRRASG